MGIKNHYILPLIYFFPFLAFLPSGAEGVEETVNIAVEKRVLLPGEHLIEVLRNTYKIPNHLIFNEYLNLIKELNPDVDDLNNMEDYQLLLIPLNLPPKNKKYKIIIIQPERVSITMPSIPEQKTPPPPTTKLERKVTLEKVDIPKLLKVGLTLLFDASGCTSQQEGIHEFPEFEGSQLSLDASIYPILQLKNNTTIIVDLGNRLPDEIKEMIHSNWSNYKIVPSGEYQGLEVTLDQLIKEMGFFKVIKHGEPLVKGKDVLCKIAGDWLVFPDNTLQRVSVINLIYSPEQKTLLPIRNYLEELAVTLIDIDLFEQSEDEDSSLVENTGKGDDVSEITRIDCTDKLTFVDTLLKLAGQDCSKNVPISIYSRESSGLALNVTIDRTFIKDGRKHLIYLQDKSPKLLHLLTKQGFPLLRLTSEEDAVTTIKKVLDFLKIHYQSPIITFATSMAEQENKIWINIPGILFETEEKKSFLTHLDLHQALTGFLAKKGITPTIYK